MPRRTRAQTRQDAAKEEKLVALPSDESAEEEEEYQTSESEAEHSKSSSSSSPSGSGDDDDDDDDGDFMLEGDEEIVKSAKQERQAIRRLRDREREKSEKSSTSPELKRKRTYEAVATESSESSDQKATDRSPVKKRGIAQRVKRPRGSSGSKKKSQFERVEDGSNLAESTGSELGKEDAAVKRSSRAARAANRKRSGTSESPEKTRGYKTAKDAPVPVVDDDGDDEMVL